MDFFIRHASGVELSNMDVGYSKEDLQPAFVPEVKGAEFQHVKALKASGTGCPIPLRWPG